MTPEDTQAIYTEMETLKVLVPQNPQLGFDNYKDILNQLRVHQDRVGDLLINVNKDFARAKILARGLKKQIEIAGLDKAGPLRDQLMAAEDELDALKHVYEALKIKKSNLFGATSDVRLTVTIMEDQLKLSGVHKPEEDVPLTASAETVDYRPPAPAPATTGRTADVEAVIEAVHAANNGEAAPAPPDAHHYPKRGKTAKPKQPLAVAPVEPPAALDVDELGLTPAPIDLPPPVTGVVEDIDAFFAADAKE